MTIPDDVMKAARKQADAIIDRMALTYRHDYGLLTGKEREGARLTFEQIAYHDIAPAIARAIMAERAARDERIRTLEAQVASWIETVTRQERALAVAADNHAEAVAASGAFRRMVCEAIDAYDVAMEEIGGCGDANCLVVRPKGQRTNGGCRCLSRREDYVKVQKFAFASTRLAAAARGGE